MNSTTQGLFQECAWGILICRRQPSQKRQKGVPLWIICAEPEYASRGCGLRGLGHKVEGSNEGLYSAQKCQPSLLEWFGVECFTSCVACALLDLVAVSRRGTQHAWIVLSTKWGEQTITCTPTNADPPCFILTSKIWMSPVLLPFCAEPQDEICRKRCPDPYMQHVGSNLLFHKRSQTLSQTNMPGCL